MAKEWIIFIDLQKDFINENGGYSKRHKGISKILNEKKRNPNAVIVISDYHENQFEKGLLICIPVPKVMK